MKAANFIAPSRIEYRADATAPEPGPGEVLVAVRACGICGSDLHMYRNGSLRHMLVTTTPEGYDVPGHELAGTIVGLGLGVEDFAIGERVVAVPSGGGGMGQLLSVPANAYQLARIPEGVSFHEAATAEPLADALQMVRKAQVQPEDNVVVFGVGIIGLGVIQALRAKEIPARQIIAVDVHDVRLAKALELGATQIVDAKQGDLFDLVAAICGKGASFHGEHANIDVVFDCAGYIAQLERTPPLQDALHMLAPDSGRIICFGGYEGRITLDLEYLVTKQPTVMGSLGYHPSELVEALELMRSGRVRRLTLISHRFALEQVREAFEAQLLGDAVKVILDIPQDAIAGV